MLEKTANKSTDSKRTLREIQNGDSFDRAFTVGSVVSMKVNYLSDSPPGFQNGGGMANSLQNGQANEGFTLEQIGQSSL